MFNAIRKYLADRRAIKEMPSWEDIDAQLKGIEERRSREVTKRFARGNVSLQLGNYVTSQEVDEYYGAPASWRE